MNAAKLLSEDGVLIVVSFHSIEDKIVKNFFNLYSNSKKNPSRYLPLNKKSTDLFKFISKKPINANLTEVKNNPNSRSAKLRYAVRNKNIYFNMPEFTNNFSKYFQIEGNRT